MVSGAHVGKCNYWYEEQSIAQYPLLISRLRGCGNITGEGRGTCKLCINALPPLRFYQKFLDTGQLSYRNQKSHFPMQVSLWLYYRERKTDDSHNCTCTLLSIQTKHHIFILSIYLSKSILLFQIAIFDNRFIRTWSICYYHWYQLSEVRIVQSLPPYFVLKF